MQKLTGFIYAVLLCAFSFGMAGSNFFPHARTPSFHTTVAASKNPGIKTYKARAGKQLTVFHYAKRKSKARITENPTLKVFQFKITSAATFFTFSASFQNFICVHSHCCTFLRRGPPLT